jgi:hypothetical protein
VEPVAGGWYEVFEAPLVQRSEAKPIGFVFGRLLVPPGVALAEDAARARSSDAGSDDESSTDTSRRSSGRGS